MTASARPCVLVLLLIFAGCVSTSSEVQMGEKSNRDILSKQGAIEGTDDAKRLDAIGQRLARVCDRKDLQYHFHLVESDELNAFTVPGGHIYFYTALFHALAADDEIAAVLAHELGHCTARHIIKRFEASVGYNIVRAVAVNAIAWKVPVPGLSSAVGLGADGAMKLATGAYSRHDEYEADRLGIKYLYLAGFDLDAMIKMFEVLQAADKGHGPPLILRTHPFLKDRIAAAKREIGTVKTKY